MTTTLSKAMHAYLDPLLQKDDVGESIVYEDLVSSWEACKNETVTEPRLKMLHRSQLHAYEKAAKQALESFAQTANIPKHIDEEDEINYFKRIYQAMDIPVWNIEQSMIDDLVGTILKRRISEVLANSNINRKNSSDSTETETEEENEEIESETEVPTKNSDSTPVVLSNTNKSDAKGLSVVEEENEEEEVEKEMQDVATTAEVPTKESNSTSAYLSIFNKKDVKVLSEVEEEEKEEEKESDSTPVVISNTNKRGVSDISTAESTASSPKRPTTTIKRLTTPPPPKNNKKAVGGKGNQNREPRNQTKAVPKKGPNTVAKTQQIRSKKSKGSNRGRGRGGNKKQS